MAYMQQSMLQALLMQQTAMIRMTQAGVTVADYNAIVVEMLANNADPLAAQVYAAIGLSHFVSMRDLYSTMTRKSTNG